MIVAGEKGVNNQLESILGAEILLNISLQCATTEEWTAHCTVDTPYTAIMPPGFLGFGINKCAFFVVVFFPLFWPLPI